MGQGQGLRCVFFFFLFSAALHMLLLTKDTSETQRSIMEENISVAIRLGKCFQECSRGCKQNKRDQNWSEPAGQDPEGSGKSRVLERQERTFYERNLLEGHRNEHVFSRRCQLLASLQVHGGTGESWQALKFMLQTVGVLVAGS